MIKKKYGGYGDLNWKMLNHEIKRGDKKIHFGGGRFSHLETV